MAQSSVAVTMLLVLLILAGLTLRLGIFLLRRGFWPQRIGREPRCAACEYLLVGISSERCPECGSTISPETTVRGERRRRVLLGWSGAGLIVLAFAFTLPLALAVFRGTDWYQSKPTFLVMLDFQSGALGQRQRALAELIRRDGATGLSSGNRLRLFQAALAEQTAAQPSPFAQQIVDYAGTLMTSNNPAISDPQKQQFLKQTVRGDLIVRKIVSAEEPIPYQLHRTGRAPSTWYVMVGGAGAAVDGKRINANTGITSGFSGIGAGGWMGSTLPRQPPGEHSLALTWQVAVYDADPGRVPAAKLLIQELRTLNAKANIVAEPAEQLIKIKDDPALTSVLHKGLEPRALTFNRFGTKNILGNIRMQNVPTDIAFDVYARYDGAEHLIGSVVATAGTGTTGIHEYMVGGATTQPAPPPRIDIILRSSRKAALGTVDLTEIWQGELIYPNIPISGGRTRTTMLPTTSPN